jgi:hypothetical protein
LKWPNVGYPQTPFNFRLDVGFCDIEQYGLTDLVIDPYVEIPVIERGIQISAFPGKDMRDTLDGVSIPAQKRDGSLQFARDITAGLLDEIAEFLEKRTTEASDATATLARVPAVEL